LATSIKAVRGFTRSYSECSVGAQLHVATQACDAALPMLIYKCSDSLTSSLRCTLKTAQYTSLYLIYKLKRPITHNFTFSTNSKRHTTHRFTFSTNSKRPITHRFTFSTNSKRPTTHPFTCPVRQMQARHRHRHIHYTVSPHGT
jgi:hypothetical protein